MNITPSSGTLQAFGTSLNSTPPSANVRQPVANVQVEQPAPNATQRADAAPRAEAPARPDADSAPPEPRSAREGQRGSLIDTTV